MLSNISKDLNIASLSLISMFLNVIHIGYMYVNNICELEEESKSRDYIKLLVANTAQCSHSCIPIAWLNQTRMSV